MILEYWNICLFSPMMTIVVTMYNYFMQVNCTVAMKLSEIGQWNRVCGFNYQTF